MSKGYLASRLLVLLLVAICSQPIVAQSGRGRQMRIAERLRGETPGSVPVPEETQTATVRENRFSLSGNIAKSKNARLIYHDDTEHHPNRADKKAGWIMLGVLAFWIGVEIANDGDFWTAR